MDESCNVARAENETISRQNDSLCHEIQEIKKDVQNEKALRDEQCNRHIKRGHEASKQCSAAETLWYLQRVKNVKSLSDLCRERRIRMEIYRRENDNLQQQINDVNRQIQSIKDTSEKTRS